MYLTRWWLHFWFPPWPWQLYSFTLVPGLLSTRSKQSSSCQNSCFFVYMKNWEGRSYKKIRTHNNYLLKLAIRSSNKKMRALSIIGRNLPFDRQTAFCPLSVKHPKEKPNNTECWAAESSCKTWRRRLLHLFVGELFFWQRINVFFHKIYRLNNTRFFSQHKSYESYNGIKCLEVRLKETKRCLGAGEIP